MKKRLFAVITSLCLLVGLFPASAFAEDIDYESVTQDGSVTTTLNYTEQYEPMGNEFVVNIPSSIRWDNSTNADFTISLGSQYNLYDGFAVNVYVAPDSFSTDGAMEFIKLTSKNDSDYFVGFSLNSDNYESFTSGNNLVARFTSSGASPNGHVRLDNCETKLDPLGDGEYSGIITFNIVSEYF